MKSRRRPSLLSLLLAAGCASTGTSATTDIRGEVVTYEAGGAVCTGFVCYDAARTGKRPGVLVVHEWWGHNDYVRDRARQLAQLGYVAFAVDMYGDGKQALHPDDAQKFAQQVFANMDAGTARFVAAKERLAAHPMTDGERIAAIGYCFGGAIVLQMARGGMDLDAVASFHGSLGTQQPAQKGTVKARVLVCHGAADALIPDDQVAAFRREMADAGVDLRFVAYPGAKHGFTSKAADANAAKFGLPLGYDAAADQASWHELQQFLAATWR